MGNRSRSSAEVKALALAHVDELRRKSVALEGMHSVLLELAERCAGNRRPDCPIIKRLAE